MRLEGSRDPQPEKKLIRGADWVDVNEDVWAAPGALLMLTSTADVGPLLPLSSSDIMVTCDICERRIIKFCSSSRARDEASSTEMVRILSSSISMCAFLEARASRRAALVAVS